MHMQCCGMAWGTTAAGVQSVKGCNSSRCIVTMWRHVSSMPCDGMKHKHAAMPPAATRCSNTLNSVSLANVAPYGTVSSKLGMPSWRILISFSSGSPPAVGIVARQVAKGERHHDTRAGWQRVLPPRWVTRAQRARCHQEKSAATEAQRVPCILLRLPSGGERLADLANLPLSGLRH